jgi:hypothetical protein
MRLKFLNNSFKYNRKFLSIFQLLLLSLILCGCGSDERQLKMKNEQKLKDSIYAVDSLYQANENKRLVDSIIKAGIPQFLTKKRAEQPRLVDEEKPAKVNVNDAERFIIERLKSSGQFIIHELITELNGIKVYMFLSAGVGNVFCITGVSENSLEVLYSDCGTENIKLADWSNLIAAGNCKVIY